MKKQQVISHQVDAVVMTIYHQIAKAMGFKFDSSLPINCLHPDCWMERFNAAIDAEGKKHSWY